MPRWLTPLFDHHKHSNSLMHHVLYVEDILREIFSYLLPLPPRCPSRSSRMVIVAVARTCRSFKEPALDILWEDLQDLTPLVRCLPGASSVNSIGVRSFKHLHGKMMIDLSAAVLTQQTAPASRLGHHPKLYAPRTKSLFSTSFVWLGGGLS